MASRRIQVSLVEVAATCLASWFRCGRMDREDDCLSWYGIAGIVYELYEEYENAHRSINEQFNM